jgi:hypothetical protein
MVLGCQSGRKVGGFVRFDDHDVAVDGWHFVSPDRQLGRRSIVVSAGVVDGESPALFWAEDGDLQS